MTVDFEDQSVLLRKIEQHALREQNLSSLPSLDQTSDNEGSDGEEERAQFEAIRRRNREAKEREENDKENRGDLQHDDLETPVPARVSKQPIYSRAQKSQRSATPPFQPTNRVLDALRSPSASTASSDQLPSLPNESGSSSNGIPVSSTPAPSRTDLRVSNTASTIKPSDNSPLEPSHKRFAKTLRHRDDVKVGRQSVGSSATGSFSIATIRHGDADGELVDGEGQHSGFQTENSLDLPRLAGHDLPDEVQYRDYAVPIKGGEDSTSFDEPTARRIRNLRRQSSGPQNQHVEAARVPDDRYDTSLEDQVNSDYSHSERNGSEMGRNMSDFTDGEEANVPAEGVVDIVIQMPDETVDSGGSPAHNWVDTRARYRSQSPNLQRSALPRSPHPRALLTNSKGHGDQERNASLSPSISGDSDRSQSSENASHTPVGEIDRDVKDQGIETRVPQAALRATADASVSFRTDRSGLEDVPEEDEYSGRYSSGATPAKGAYSPHHSTLSTPGVGRNASLAETPLQQTQPPSFDTMIRDRSLRDITHTIQHGPYDSPAPSEYLLGSSKAGSLQTPKPGDKTPANFLLSRLESTSKPLRYKAIRGRMSVAGGGDFVRNNHADTSVFGQSIAHIQGGQREEEFDVGEISSVSLSSSLDLTTDKRMSTARRGRGNMSVPEINFSDGASQDGVDPSNLVKEMRLINIGLQQENENVNREKEDLLQWCRSQGYQLPGQFFDDAHARTDDNAIPTSNSNAPDNSITQRLQQAEEDCQQKELELSQLREKLKVQADLESRLQSLQRDIETKTETNQRDRAEIDSLKNQLEEQDEAANQEKADLEADFQELEDNFRVLRQEKDRLARDLEMANMDEGHSQLQDELHDLRTELQRSKEQLEEYEETIRDLQAKLQGAVDENARFVGDAFQAEDAAKDASLARENLQSDLNRQRTENHDLHDQIRNTEAATADLEARLHESEQQYTNGVEARQSLVQQVRRLTTENNNLVSEKEMLQEEVDRLHDSVEATAGDLQHSEEKYLQETRRASELQRQLDILTEALQAARADITSLEKELAGRGDISCEAETTRHMTSELARAESTIVHLRSRLEACEEQLETTRHQSGAQARQMAVIRQKDVKIETLTTEKAALLQQVQLLADQQSNLSMAKDPRTPGDPAKTVVSGTPFSALRPINRVLMNLRTPRTPGQLSDMTWLSSSSFGGGAEEMMLAQLQTMGEELKKANQHIDNNFNELEKRGVLGCSLADELAEAHSQIAGLREDLQALQKQQYRAIDQLLTTSCPECDFSFDASEPLRAATAKASPKNGELGASISHPDRSRLRQSLAILRDQYETLKQEHEQYHQQHAAEVQTLNKELDLLADERAKTTEENRKALLQLEQEHVEQIRKLRSEKEMLDDDKHSMQQRLIEVHKELESNALKSKALQRDLDAANMRIHGLKTEGGELRTENQSLTSEVSDMRKRVGAAEQAAKESQRLRSEIQTLEAQYKASREATSRSEQSRDRLQEQLVVLQERLASANDKLASEAKSHDGLRKQLASLESCLQDHRREAEDFNHALKAMQSQHERNRKRAEQAETLAKDNDQAAQTIARLQKQLEDVETRLVQSTSDPRASSQASRTAEPNEMQSRLIADRKILTGQIRFLHALYARENTFRDGLLVQKQYLLRLLGKFRQTEKETLALIASMGYPPLATKSNSRFTFKSVALAVRFTVKMKNSSEQWQQILQKRPDRQQNRS